MFFIVWERRISITETFFWFRCMYVCACLCMCTRVYIIRKKLPYTHIYMYIYVYMYIHVCIYIYSQNRLWSGCMYVYRCVCMYTHVYIARKSYHVHNDTYDIVYVYQGRKNKNSFFLCPEKAQEKIYHVYNDTYTCISQQGEQEFFFVLSLKIHSRLNTWLPNFFFFATQTNNKNVLFCHTNNR